MNKTTNCQYIIPDISTHPTPTKVRFFVCFAEFDGSADQMHFALMPYPFDQSRISVSQFVALRDKDIVKQRPIVEMNPLNFNVPDASYVIIRLIGETWQFSGVITPHLTTKEDYGDRHWGLHWFDAKGDIVQDMKLKHEEKLIGFYSTGVQKEETPHRCFFNTDFVYQGTEVLPVSLDPDIQNKGE